MSERVTFEQSTGVLELPEGRERAPAVVIVHEWWGVNDQIQGVAKQWAAEGYVALVPDLFHGHVATTAAEAQTAMSKLDFARAVKEIGAAVEYLTSHARCTGKVSLTGYCMGGALCFAAACQVKGLAAVVPFYGLPPTGDWGKVDAPIQAHFATHDDWATVEGAKKIQASVPVPMELHVYDAQHAFANERRPEVFDKDAAAQSFGRAVAFVRQHS